MRIVLLILAIATISLNAGLKRLTLNRAIELLQESNLEIKVSKYDEMMKFYDISKVKAKNYGTLDISLTAMRSNDAGNVFGFKVQSRSAAFADFGFADFMGAIGQGAMGSKGDFGAFSQGLAASGGSILAIEPKDLNYPVARNHFLTKIEYKVPLYTGGMLSNYKKITTKLYEMSKLDTQKVLSLKKYELKKTFYDVALVNSFISNLRNIKSNIRKLKRVIKEMQREGYAVETDYLEVDAKLAEVEAMLDEATLNRELAYHFISFLIDNEVSSIVAPKHNPRVPVVTKEVVESRSLDIAKARLGLKITKDAIEVEKAKFKPTVGAFAEYGNANDKIFKYSKKGFYTVGVQAKLNLFNGGADSASLQKAKVNYLKVSTQVKLAKKGMWLKASKLKSEVKSLSARVRSYKKQYKFAKRVYSTYKTKYREGIVSITDLLIKQSLEIEKLMKLLKIKNERNAKILELENLING
jgi:outer membrane protein TolC